MEGFRANPFTANEPCHAAKKPKLTLLRARDWDSTSFRQTVAALISVAVAGGSAGSIRAAGWPPQVGCEGMGGF